MVNYYLLSTLKENKILFNKLVSEILNVTIPVKKQYPNYKNWFLNTHIPNIGINRETVVALINNNIVGVANLKFDNTEKKLCTLYIKEGFRFNKIGTELLNMSFEILGTNKPVITISDDVIFHLRKFILKNNWELSQKLDNFYSYDHNEYVFNGSIYLPINDEISKIYRKENNNIIRITLLHILYNHNKNILKYIN